MTTETKRQPLTSGGHVWGARRVAAGISLRQLAEASGVPKGNLSMMEHGRLIPTAAEFDAVMTALMELAPRDVA